MGKEIAVIKVDGEVPPFVYNSWLKSFKFGSSFARDISAKVFFDRHHELIERVLKAPTTSVFIATSSAHPGLIVGYLVVQEEGPTSIIHFAYTKAHFRRMGVMGELLTSWGGDPNRSAYTHKTYDARWFCQKYPGLVYNP